MMGYKTVNVRMSAGDHSIFKAYCVLVNKTMSEVLYDWARHELHSQSIACQTLTQLMENHNKTLDLRVHKPCWGWRCNLCQHETACRVGLENKLFIMNPKFYSSLKPQAEHVKSFDGTSVDCCKPNQVFDKLNYKNKS